MLCPSLSVFQKWKQSFSPLWIMWFLCDVQRLILTTRWPYLHYYQRQSFNMDFFFQTCLTRIMTWATLTVVENNSDARLLCAWCAFVFREMKAVPPTAVTAALPGLGCSRPHFKIPRLTIKRPNNLKNCSQLQHIIPLEIIEKVFFRQTFCDWVFVVSAIQLKNTLFVVVQSIQTASFSLLIKNMISWLQ